MEASVATKEVPPEPVAAFDGAAEATRTTEELFQWSTYVHVGAGATECEHGEDGTCTDFPHFHAWLKLPNVFQTRDIQDKAEAARARKRRALKDPTTDAYAVLEEGIEAWGLTPETLELLAGQLASQRVQAEYTQLRESLLEDDRFEHYAADIEEFKRLGDVPEEERDEEDFERLGKMVEEFKDEYLAAINRRVATETERLKQIPKDELLDLERRNVIDVTAGEVFLHTKYTWSYFICALKPVKAGTAFPSARVFENPEAMKGAPPEVVNALRDAFRSLEGRMLMRSDAAGN
jgi:hypothetical protein